LTDHQLTEVLMPDQFYRSHILLCTDPECLAKGANDIEDALLRELEANGLREEVNILETSRLGHCRIGPEIVVYPEGVAYVNLTPAAVTEIVTEHLLKGRIAKKYEFTGEVRKDEELRAPTAKEMRIIMSRCGVIDPDNIEDYIAEDGYAALGKVLSEMTPRQVIDEVLRSGLRGRGGAGFPAGKKWEFAAAQKSDVKYLICNADEGDPGAFMNRRVLEGDPHAVLEGMVIAGYAIGAHQGYIYVRAEYPIAVRTLKIAIRQAREFGFLGKDILGSGHDFDVELRIGAGAFVCGEETALMASIEGRRGEPRPRPPFPAVAGLWGKPTIINNVETLANIRNIILRGADWFRTIGTERSTGTKTFTLAGDVLRTGLIEVPLGISLREVVYDVAGGIKDGRKFKAIQTGGPMGGCIPEHLLDTPLDYEPLGALGSIMGSGGLVVMDDTTCMVDIARFFMDFTQDESCGKCVPCRIGTRRILEILQRICAGDGEDGDIERLERLSQFVVAGSLCGLGQGAPNPVVTTIRHFRHEYETHIYEKRCPAKVCKGLITYRIVDACTGCMVCARNCPTKAITGEKQKLHVINEALCERCGICMQVCKFSAIVVE
jgi:NADH:ubiquinone oxidoreductase subunit F (NADH-binding)/(2Fe-2S) ferredoxin